MNREFLDFYNRELSLLYEQAGEFAGEIVDGGHGECTDSNLRIRSARCHKLRASARLFFRAQSRKKAALL